LADFQEFMSHKERRKQAAIRKIRKGTKGKYRRTAARANLFPVDCRNRVRAGIPGNIEKKKRPLFNRREGRIQTKERAYILKSTDGNDRDVVSGKSERENQRLGMRGQGGGEAEKEGANRETPHTPHVVHQSYRRDATEANG